MFIKETVGTDAEGVWAPDIEQSFQVNMLLVKINLLTNVLPHPPPSDLA